MSKIVVAVDIGSTYTKGASINIDGINSKIITWTRTPTTEEDLTKGFNSVLNELLKGVNINNAAKETYPIYFSSSAKGGLTIAAIGIVPDLTLKMAELVSLSAGGKIIKQYSYNLTKNDISELETLNPDIVFLTGGTDGGNEEYNLNNAKSLGDSNLTSTFIYSGNKKIADQIFDALKDKEISITENIMPQIDIEQPQPAQKMIRNKFIETISTGKGLSGIIKQTGTKPLPTPLVVLNLIKKIGELRKDWKNFSVIDLGGATTDFYSNSDPVTDAGAVIYKGDR